ncbi:hypothetical protein ACHAXN_005486, partial [Cyclotella atomus]
VGCQEGNFTLKTLLHLRRQHNLPSFVAFIDLVKAYDTANHCLLIELLAKYGAPPEFCSIIKRLYSGLTVVINLDGKKITIPQSSGVRQGDNLSPVLFLFVMSAVVKSLNEEIENTNIEKVVCHKVEEDNITNGILIGQTPSKFSSGTTFNILEILYIDDGAFIFNSRRDLIQGLNIIIKQFAKFGLLVHV